MSKVSIDTELVRKRLMSPYMKIGYPYHELGYAFAYPSPPPAELKSGYEQKAHVGRLWVDNPTATQGNVALGFFNVTHACHLLDHRPILQGDVKIRDVKEYALDTWLRAGLVITIMPHDETKWRVGAVEYGEFYNEYDFYRSLECRKAEAVAGVILGGTVTEYYLTMPRNLGKGVWRHFDVDVYETLVKGYGNQGMFWGRHVADVAKIFSVYVVIEAWKGMMDLDFENFELVW